MSRFGHESSEQLHYIPARLEVHETQRLKYSCGHCHGAVVRAQLPVLAPIPKSMASASLLAYLIVSKFADGLPLYRIAGRLARLGVELSHTDVRVAGGLRRAPRGAAPADGPQGARFRAHLHGRYDHAAAEPRPYPAQDL